MLAAHERRKQHDDDARATRELRHVARTRQLGDDRLHVEGRRQSSRAGRLGWPAGRLPRRAATPGHRCQPRRCALCNARAGLATRGASGHPRARWGELASAYGLGHHGRSIGKKYDGYTHREGGRRRQAPHLRTPMMTNEPGTSGDSTGERRVFQRPVVVLGTCERVRRRWN
jgi:hypothetical protein